MSRASVWLTPVELTLLGAIWGASFMFQRVAAPAFGALPMVELRLLFAVLPLLPFLWRDRASFRGGVWWRIVMVGAINSGIPFVLFAWATERAPAGIGAISNATTAIFAPLLALLLFGEQIHSRRVIGIVAGFVGVVVLASGRTAGASVTLAAIAGTCGGFLYALGAVLLRRHLSALPVAALAAATLGCSAILIAPLAILTWPQHAVAPVAWWNALAVGLLCTGVPYVFYYRLLRRIGAARSSIVTYLIPLFGVLWAWLFLSEPVTPTMAIACALILFGVAMSQHYVTPAGQART
jgi:drug/metabolite transporter (DMT)-like permease